MARRETRDTKLGKTIGPADNKNTPYKKSMVQKSTSAFRASALKGALKFFEILLVVLTALLAGCSGIANIIATKVYPSLDQPWSRETAPTAVTFPASADVRAVIGGRGEGVGCSIPKIAEALMFDNAARRESPVSLQFRQACVFHDFCYRHGHATYGYSKSDCDFLLQEYAYRLCRQIYVSDPGQEVCRERARVVLLGVDIFGGENFAHGHKSTYFEFDPFPRRADDYVVARLARAAIPATAGIGAPPREERQLWSFYFKGGWIGISQFAGGERLGRASVPFLRFKVPVPPYVVDGGDGPDRFVWFGRRSLGNSGVYAFEIDASLSNIVGETLWDRVGKQETENTNCETEDRQGKNRLERGFAALEFDCNTSVSKPLVLRCGAGRSKTLIVTTGHAGPSDLNKEPPQQTVAAHCGDTLHALALSATKLRQPPFEKSTERFLQNEFLTGNFTSATESDQLVLGRGYNSGGQESQDFRKSTTVLVRPFSPDSAGAVHPELVLPEDFEPVAPFRPDGADTDRLIAVFAPGPPDKSGPVQILEWEPGKRSNPVTNKPLEPGLDREWLRQPAQVIAAKRGGDLLFFSRVVSADTEKSMDDLAFVPTRVQLQFRAFRRTATKWTEAGTACIAVDLGKQIGVITEAPVTRFLSKDAAALCASMTAADIAKALVNAPHSIEGVLPEDKAKWQAAEAVRACVALRRDLAERWHRSQVIPGYLYGSSDLNAKSGGDHLLDAVFVFNGFPAYSVWIHGDNPTHPGWAKRCDAAP